MAIRMIRLTTPALVGHALACPWSCAILPRKEDPPAGRPGSRFSLPLYVPSVARTSINPAVLHDEDHMAHGGDVVERVALDGHQIGLQTFGDRTDLICH